MAKYSVGIDLGTTHSCVGIYDKEGRAVILSNEHGYRTTPSYVSFTSEERHIGKTAKDLVGRNPRNTVYDAKRLIGKKFSDPLIQKEMKYLSFDLSGDENDKPLISVDYLDERRTFYPEEISAMILGKMKSIVEGYIKDEIKDVVVTVPAYFNDAQRLATKDAGRIAGLNVLRIINEPTAAAIAYGLNNRDIRNVLVYDLGGGTLDVTVLTMIEGALTVKATQGDTHLGGEDFDNKLREYCVLKFAEKNILKTKLTDEEKATLTEYLRLDRLLDMFDLRVDRFEERLRQADIRKDIELSEKLVKYLESVKKVLKIQENVKLMRKLKTICEDAKKSLSTSKSIKISYDEFYKDCDLDVSVSRAKFESICKDKFDRCLNPVLQALDDAEMTPKDIDDVVLVGGSTRMPKIQALLNELFPGKLKSDINPDEAVAYGATIQAALINQSYDGSNEIVIVDATPLSLGIETKGGVMDVVIPRGTNIPVEECKIYSTAQDNQSTVTVKVFEGERALTKHNNLLGKFNLEGIPPMKKREPKIKVFFRVNEDGIMSVSAHEEKSGSENKIVIKNERDRLTEEEIAEMTENAEKFAQRDKEIADKINAKISLENYIDALSESISDVKFTEMMSKDVTKELTEDLGAVSMWLEDDEDVDKEECDIRYKRLEDKFMPILEKYQLAKNPKSENKNKEL